MKLGEVGERKLIELIRKRLGKEGEKVGVGDDAAFLKFGKSFLVVTTDILFQHTHFPPQTEPEQMGWKAAVASLSDLAAMGAVPLGMLFSIGMPGGAEVDFFGRILEGIEKVAKRYKAPILGGDLNEDEEVVICGTALGLADSLLRRNGAKVGDLVAVTNTVGKASAGLHLLLNSLPSSGYQELLHAFLYPQPRLPEGEILREYASSAIDLSDSLASGLWFLSKESRVKILLQKVPTDPLVQRFSSQYGLDPLEFSLFGGEDYELLFTAPEKNMKDIEKRLNRVGSKVNVIGKVERGKGVFWVKNGALVELPDRGYEHFRK